MKVWVCSKNPQKINAAKAVFQQTSAIIDSFAVPSHVDQPVGDQTLLCAYRRIEDLRNSVEVGPNDIVIAMENGLEVIDTPLKRDDGTIQRWALDKAYIVVYDQYKNEYHVASSCGIVVDKDYQNVETYGIKYHAQSSLDNYIFHTNKLNDRITILKEALQLLMNTITK